MDIRTARREFQKLLNGTNKGPEFQALADAIAQTFLGLIRHDPGQEGHYAFISLLAEMAIHDDPLVSIAGSSAFYSGVVESLCDNFCSKDVGICNRAIVRMLDIVRSATWGTRIDQTLAGFGLHNEEDILNRYERIARASRQPIAARRSLKKILILSRVTIGADIAITSVLIKRLVERFPKARLVLIAPAKQAEILGDHPRLHLHPLNYGRSGPLSNRLSTWPDIVAIAQAEIAGLDPEEWLLFDPDSRLSQLGLLPVVAEGNTYAFNSRCTPLNGEESSLSILANRWLDPILSNNNSACPTTWIPSRFKEQALRLKEKIGKTGCRHLITINLGVGGNERKRIAGAFEETMLVRLLRDATDSMVLLDSGSSVLGLERIKSLLAIADRQGIPVDFMDEKEMPDKNLLFAHGIIGFHGSLGALAALLSFSDAFIGYDSACQHLASALGIPFIILFAGAPNTRFITRWMPTGQSDSVTIPVDKTQDLSGMEIASIIEQVLTAANVMRKRATP